MAIFTNVYGDGHTPDYEGCVLDWYEHNGYDDSDWYAICWNEEKQTIDKVLFATWSANAQKSGAGSTPAAISCGNSATNRSPVGWSAVSVRDGGKTELASVQTLLSDMGSKPRWCDTTTGMKRPRTATPSIRILGRDKDA